MRPVHSVAEIRSAERAAIAAVGEGVLIQRAATAVARRGAQLLGAVYGSRVVVCAGKGHNGADALWAGWFLQQRGARVDVALTAEPGDEHGAEPLRRLLAAGARRCGVGGAAEADLVIDGLLGIGASGPLRGPVAEQVAAFEGHPLVLAVDVPTGIDADTGAAADVVVTAVATVTFGALKRGLVTGRGAECAGQVEVAGIGIDTHLGPSRVGVTDADDVRDVAASPTGDTSKYRRGVVGVVAGSERYPGAAALACVGALRAGAGMVLLFAAPDVVAEVRAAHPEVVGRSRADIGDPKVDAYAVGPGLGTDGGAGDAVAAVLATDQPVLVDADGVTLLAADPRGLRRSPPTLVTPHAGEFARLTGLEAAAIAADRIGSAMAAADRLGATVLLKGLHTVVAAPGGAVRVNPTGTPWLATAGTGDVLSGGAATYLALGASALDAGAAAAFLHGLGARLAAQADGVGAPVTAGDVAAHWPAALRAISSL